MSETAPAPTAAATGRWELFLRGFRPASLNELLSGGRWGAARLKKRDRQWIGFAAHLARVPRATGRRRVSLHITLPASQRRWDEDALYKSALDSCVSAGLLIDDGPKWCALGPVTYERTGTLSTTITLEELPPEELP